MEIYFCLMFIESEHDYIAKVMQEVCTSFGLHLAYYRKLRDGHVPMYREVRITGPQKVLSALKKSLEAEWKLYFFIERDPYEHESLSR